MTVYSMPRDMNDLNGCHVLALLPPSNKNPTRFLTEVLVAAKARWNWKASVICDRVDRRAFKQIIIPDGKVYLRPDLLRVRDWEQDEAALAEVEDRMRDAEVVAGLPVGRIVLAGSHGIGRAYYMSVRLGRSFALERSVVTDNVEPYRIVRRLFQFADEVLENAKPDLIYFFEWATSLNFVTWIAAQRRGIPCVALRYSKIIADNGYWTSDRLMLNNNAIAGAEKAREFGAPTSDAAIEYVSSFRERPAVIKYIATRWQNRRKLGFIRWHLRSSRASLREFINGFRGRRQTHRGFPLERFFRYYHSLFLSWWNKRYLHTLDDETLAKTKYIYLPLHKEAELAQTFQATLWHDQRNTVQVLASMLPFGYRLLVREHRMNYGYRPTRSYRQLSKIPNVTLIDPFDSQFKYIRHADLVVTENGSAGWEGMLFRRRVLLLSPTFYDGAGLGVRMRDPDELNRAILNALAEPQDIDAEGYDRALGCMFDAERENSFTLSGEGIPAALEQLAKMLKSSEMAYPNRKVVKVTRDAAKEHGGATVDTARAHLVQETTETLHCQHHDASRR